MIEITLRVGSQNMNLADIRILLTRTCLAIERQDSYPRTMQQARGIGKARADALIKRLALSAHEADILTQTVDKEVIFRTTPRNALRKGLGELIRFRSARQRMRGDKLQATFIPASQWPEEWSRERHLTLLFKPAISPSQNSLEPAPHDFNGKRFENKYLIVDNFYNIFSQIDQYRSESLRGVRLIRHSDPFLWKGSHFNIEEEKEPNDIGRGPIPTHTAINASGALAAPTYDFLLDQLSSGQNPISEGEAIWLAISFPFSGDKIPQRRYVGPNGVNPDPCKVMQNAPRLCLQLARVPIVRSRDEPRTSDLIGQWMVIEKER